MFLSTIVNSFFIVCMGYNLFQCQIYPSTRPFLYCICFSFYQKLLIPCTAQLHMKKELVSRIKKANQHRDPEFLAKKYQAMYDDKYRFFRGTAHLFFEDIPSSSFLWKAPAVWICGDLHLENFGSYKGDNRIAYFNINDFDESVLASPLLDVVRLIISLRIAAVNLKIPVETAYQLSSLFVNTYFDKLKQGYILTLEKETTTGVIRKFLEEVKNRRRKTFIRERTILERGKISIRIDNLHASKIKKSEKLSVITAMENWSKKMKTPSFFNVKDVALRMAGTSSLGLKRYVVLIEGKGEDYGNYLLEIKETRPSCLKKYVSIQQPEWNSEAERIIEIEKRVLANPPALLNSISIGDKNFVMNEKHPSADRINYKLFASNFRKLASILHDMACILAWNNLRTTGRQGSAIADELIAFAAEKKELEKKLTTYATAYSKKIDLYHKEYGKAFKAGAFKIK
jgi:uncharacterized protein (DUF2252 family)